MRVHGRAGGRDPGPATTRVQTSPDQSACHACAAVISNSMRTRPWDPRSRHLYRRVGQRQSHSHGGCRPVRQQRDLDDDDGVGAASRPSN